MRHLSCLLYTSTLGFAEENVKKYQAIITPIDIAGERLGTLFIYKSDAQYDIDDIILSEYGTTVVGLEMMLSLIHIYRHRGENQSQVPADPPAAQVPGIYDRISGGKARLVLAFPTMIVYDSGII